ncbi:mechanosensitive ion channel family protein [Euzebya tangerina]|uniref:mechanosensitive ion channel family protein n=1 Tax=Euzebya tangerina TaxID=591198 RepID=UPI0013C2D028|nr:mechanosensitive ion channel family protein [Euzebya tangerina]
MTLLLAQDATETPADDTDLGDVVPEVDLGCGTDDVICSWVLDVTGSETLAALVGQILPVLITIVLIFVGAVIVSRIAKRIIHSSVTRTASESRSALQRITRRAPGFGSALSSEAQVAVDARKEQRAETIATVLGSIAVFVIYLIAVFIALSQVNIDIGPLVAGAGVVGVALGFGAQSLVKDFLSGIFMILEDQYGVGDVVDVGEATGVVEGITLRVTRLRDVEGTVWHVPNGEIVRVGNKSQLWSRSLLDIAVAYDTDLDRAGEVIAEVAHGMAVDEEWDPFILEEPELWGIEQFGPNEVVLRLVMKVLPAEQWRVNREFRARIKKAFDAEGIEIPFPQRTIWVKNDADPAAGIPASASPQGQEDGRVHESEPTEEPS